MSSWSRLEAQLLLKSSKVIAASMKEMYSAAVHFSNVGTGVHVGAAIIWLSVLRDSG
jgi:hypothetical protein